MSDKHAPAELAVNNKRQKVVSRNVPAVTTTAHLTIIYTFSEHAQELWPPRNWIEVCYIYQMNARICHSFFKVVKQESKSRFFPTCSARCKECGQPFLIRWQPVKSLFPLLPKQSGCRGYLCRPSLTCTHL